MSEQRERARIEAQRQAEVRQRQRRSRSTRTQHSEFEQSGGFFNTLFRQIIISGAIIAFLFGVKGIDNPSAKALNSHIQSAIKYNIEYDWIISNINKSTEYILSMFK